MSSGKVQIYFHWGSKLEIPNTSVAAQLEAFSTVVKTRLLLLLIEDARSSRHPLQKYKRKIKCDGPSSLCIYGSVVGTTVPESSYQ